MANDIVQCTECQAKNRLRPASQATADGSSKLPRCGKCKAPLPWLIDATDASFDLEANAPVPVLVDLWAPWCGPCRIVAPVLAELSRDKAGQLKVIKVNVDENPQLAARFNARSIPMLLVVVDGEVKKTVVGAQPKAVLWNLVESLI